MTIDISNNTPRISYSVAAGVTQTSFAVPFEFFADTDLNVYVDEVLQTITTNYTVSGGDGSTGTVTMTVTGAKTVIITRDTTIERTTDFTAGVDINRAALNTQLDTLTAIGADVKDLAERSIRIKDFDPSTASLELPAASVRANKLMMFDTEGAVSLAAEETLGNIILGANFITDAFTGDGTQTAFTLSTSPNSKNNAQVHIDGVYQNKASFSLSGTTLTFSEAPPLNSSIEVVSGDSISEGSTANSSAVDYNQGGTGAVDRTVKAKLQETVSVKDFGAIGDGVTDDSAAIQAAVTASSGKFLFFPKGTYIVNSTITVPSGSIGFVGENSTLKTNVDGPTGSSRRLFNFSGSTSDILLDGLTCDGDRANRTQAYTDTGTVAGVSVCGPDERVNWFRATSTRSFTVRNCRFINMHGSAIEGQGVEHFVVDGCYFENIAGTACKAVQCDSSSFTNNKAIDIGILPATFLLDGVSKTFSVDTGIHMQYGDAFYADGVGYVTAMNNHVRNVSRCAFVSDTSTSGSIAKAIFTGNTIVNNHARLRCGNPHGAIWLENTSTGIVKGNVIRQVLRDDNETAIRSIVIVGASGEDVEDFIVEGNNVVHEGYRTTVPVSDYILYLSAPIQGDNPVLQVRNNSFINLDTDSGQVGFVEAKTTAEGSLIISGNTMINRSTVSTASALTFYADAANQWFKIVQIENNMFECDNTSGSTTGSCLSFYAVADFSNASLEISGNDFSRSLNNAVYVGSFEGDTFVFTGNRAATLDADLRQDRQAHITNNVFGSETSTQTTSIDHQGTTGTCNISNNSVFGRMRTRTVTGNPNRAMVFSGNTFYAESGNDPCLLIGGNNEDITISNNTFYATADSQELLRWAANASNTSDRSFIVGNIFQGAGHSSVTSINYSTATTYSTNQVVADNRMNDATEGGTGAPRNTNT